jgi:7-cyano-7-deazaguanine synthase
MHSAALVLFSGGQDSTTCLAWALDRYHRVETIGFDYGQRHRIELECRTAILSRIRRDFSAWGGKLGEDRVLTVDVLKQLGETALTGNVELAMGADGLPTTFVPGRNLVFLALAGALAYRRGLTVLVTGVCETDYSGYPDCRDDTIKAMQLALNLGMNKRFTVETPLMWKDKAATWKMAESLGGKELVELLIEESHTCYKGERTIRHEWGYGCAACPACELRANGYRRFHGDHSRGS